MKEEKSIKINIPEGYAVDTENSTFTEIKFKPIIKKYPKSWEDEFYGRQIDGYYICSGSDIYKHSVKCSNSDKNVFKTKAQAKAALAYAQLTQLMALPCYNGEWIPDWTSSETKYCIVCEGEEVTILTTCKTHFDICFKTKEIRDIFLQNHLDLLKIYFQSKK